MYPLEMTSLVDSLVDLVDLVDLWTSGRAKKGSLKMSREKRKKGSLKMSREKNFLQEKNPMDRVWQKSVK